MHSAIMSKSEFFAWKKIMEEKIERKELTPLEEGNVRLFCVLNWNNPCWCEDDMEEQKEDLTIK